MGLFEISKAENVIKRMTPEKRFYNSGKQMTTEAAIVRESLGSIHCAW